MESARINSKEREKKESQLRREEKRKRIKAQRMKPPTPSWAIDALIGDEKQKYRAIKKIYRLYINEIN